MKKRFGIGWYGGVVAAVLMVLAMIGYYVMSRDGEAAPFTVYAAALAGLVLQAVALALTVRKGETPSAVWRISFPPSAARPPWP